MNEETGDQEMHWLAVASNSGGLRKAGVRSSNFQTFSCDFLLFLSSTIPCRPPLYKTGTAGMLWLERRWVWVWVGGRRGAWQIPSQDPRTWTAWKPWSDDTNMDAESRRPCFGLLCHLLARKSMFAHEVEYSHRISHLEFFSAYAIYLLNVS